MKVQSDKTAIRRYDLSRPLKYAMLDDIITKEHTVFDYGCGRGDDLEILLSMNIKCEGWDPAHRPKVKKKPADIVNCGFVINVIEDQQERSKALLEAYALTKKVLLVASMLDISSNTPASCRLFGDGHLTSRNTFQKLYSQTELCEYINQALNVESIPAAPGIFYVFKDEEIKEKFLENRTRRHIEFLTRPRISIAEKYESHRDLLEDFMQAIYKLGRIPREEEYPKSIEVKQKIGSLRKAYSIVQHVFPGHEIEKYRQRRYEDLLVYLALTHFRKHPALNSLPLSVQNDMKIFFGSYQKAKITGKELLFSAGNTDKVIEACLKSKIGKKLPDDLYVHRAYVDRLSPLLRVYYGCAEAFIGEVEDIDIIKFHMISGKLSYLRYEKFDFNPHPKLLNTTTVILREQRVRFLEFSDRENPPILHRKETMVDSDYPFYNKFKKLTEAEEKAGLLERGEKGFGLLNLWQERLTEKGYTIRGHQLRRVTKNRIRSLIQ